MYLSKLIRTFPDIGLEFRLAKQFFGMFLNFFVIHLALSRRLVQCCSQPLTLPLLLLSKHHMVSFQFITDNTDKFRRHSSLRMTKIQKVSRPRDCYIVEPTLFINTLLFLDFQFGSELFDLIRFFHISQQSTGI